MSDPDRLHTEEFCREVPEDVGSYPRHCFHEHGEDLICCWCGDLFLAESPQEHGEYWPHWRKSEAT